MLWTAEASSLAVIANLSEIIKKRAEHIAILEGSSAVTPAHLHAAVKQIELGNNHSIFPPTHNANGIRPKKRQK